MKLKKILDKYDTLIFDMDGVMTYEGNYWNAAALTIYEFLHSDKYAGSNQIDTAWCMNNLKKIRSDIFHNDELIMYCKDIGVNSNWDLAYVVFCCYVICGTENSDIVYDYMKSITGSILDEYDNLAKSVSEKTGKNINYTRRDGKLWTALHDCFQEWYLGDELFEEVFYRKPVNPGKTGVINCEIPLIPIEKLEKMLILMKKAGKRLCVGTGRPYIEIKRPLEKWGILKYFDEKGFCHYGDVEKAQDEFNMILSKPHPFVFLKALFGGKCSDKQLVNNEYDKDSVKRTLIVGDAGADIFAAQAMNADFCAVLTGVNGKKSKPFFEKSCSTYILDNVLELMED